MYHAIIFLIFPICLILAALTDFLEMTIPNRIPAILLGAFLLIAPFSGLSLVEFGWHLAAAALVFAVCFSLFALNVMGGGDAKLLTAAAIWFGFNTSLFEFLAFTGYFGGALTVIIILLRANWDKVAIIGVKLPQALMTAKKVPYAIAIGAAGLMTYPQSPLVIAAIKGLG
ncbi:peptidase A24A prepilin type IV [Rhizobium sp. PDO1-076]|uniref:A24 family peptidase n=1 Tax=Rhizobium sp. PDO1-076 TaxID=1125979 RepID=UPI00024E275F|nr:prepilin peptidase [Rhizobium sp. PDO1-076]EHS52417.1 peptidase A24A prepilin type IV [Rhizobium sp. PDO1-076]